MTMSCLPNGPRSGSGGDHENQTDAEAGLLHGKSASAAICLWRVLFSYTQAEPCQGIPLPERAEPPQGLEQYSLSAISALAERAVAALVPR